MTELAGILQPIVLPPRSLPVRAMNSAALTIASGRTPRCS